MTGNEERIDIRMSWNTMGLILNPVSAICDVQNHGNLYDSLVSDLSDILASVPEYNPQTDNKFVVLPLTVEQVYILRKFASAAEAVLEHALLDMKEAFEDSGRVDFHKESVASKMIGYARRANHTFEYLSDEADNALAVNALDRALASD